MNRISRLLGRNNIRYCRIVYENMTKYITNIAKYIIIEIALNVPSMKHFIRSFLRRRAINKCRSLATRARGKLAVNLYQKVKCKLTLSVC